MEGFIDNAKKFLATDQGQQIEQQIEQGTGIDVDKYLKSSGQPIQGGNPDPQTQDPSAQPPARVSTDAFGNEGQAGQFGAEGQYGAVRGKGFGGGLASGAQGQGGQQDQGESAYAGMDQGDSTSSGGYNTNEAGDAFSRRNQMGADDPAPAVHVADKDHDNDGYKTGTSTPGYRQENDADAQAAEDRIRNQNEYGKQADDRGAAGNDYNEAI